MCAGRVCTEGSITLGLIEIKIVPKLWDRACESSDAGARNHRVAAQAAIPTSTTQGPVDSTSPASGNPTTPNVHRKFLVGQRRTNANNAYPRTTPRGFDAAIQDLIEMRPRCLQHDRCRDAGYR
jgi:hypothetical protein